MRALTVFSLALLALSTSAGAAMFKWKDADGNVQYGQYPPAGSNAEPVKVKPAPRSAPATPATTPQERLEALEKNKQEARDKQAEAEREKTNTEIRKRNCENARRNLATLERGGNRRTLMPDGSYGRLDDAARQARLEENRKAAEEFCN